MNTLAPVFAYLATAPLGGAERGILSLVAGRCAAHGGVETLFRWPEIGKLLEVDSEAGYFQRSARKLRDLGVLVIERKGPAGVLARLNLPQMRLFLGEGVIEWLDNTAPDRADIAENDIRPIKGADSREYPPSMGADIDIRPFRPSSSTTQLQEIEKEGRKGRISEGRISDEIVLRAMLADAPKLLAWTDGAPDRRLKLVGAYVEAFHDANRAPAAFVAKLEYWLAEGQGTGPLVPELLETRLLDLASEHYPTDGRRIDSFLRGAGARAPGRRIERTADLNTARGSVAATYRSKLTLDRLAVTKPAVND